LTILLNFVIFLLKIKKGDKKMVYGYVRVSTEEQNLENQKKAISEKYKVRKWIEEKKSGTIDYHKRNLGVLIEQLKEGDILVTTEISRLGRSLNMIFRIISELQNKGVRVIAIKNNFDLNPQKKNDITSQVLMFAFGLSAQIERDLISERTKQGLAVAKANGKQIGRRKGETIYHVKLRKYEKQIMRDYKNHKSINSIATKYNVNWITVKRFIDIYSKMPKPIPLTERPKKHGHPTYAELEYFKTHS
jgi:DNA invertase Pin-like site-specific DNA recombinase